MFFCYCIISNAVFRVFLYPFILIRDFSYNPAWITRSYYIYMFYWHMRKVEA